MPSVNFQRLTQATFKSALLYKKGLLGQQTFTLGTFMHTGLSFSR
eukprot:COSAG02_NODE_60278_length_271_cov_2.093023_1_plen_44_part_01